MCLYSCVGRAPSHGHGIVYPGFGEIRSIDYGEVEDRRSSTRPRGRVRSWAWWTVLMSTISLHFWDQNSVFIIAFWQVLQLKPRKRKWAGPFMAAESTWELIVGCNKFSLIPIQWGIYLNFKLILYSNEASFFSHQHFLSIFFASCL